MADEWSPLAIPVDCRSNHLLFSRSLWRTASLHLGRRCFLSCVIRARPTHRLIREEAFRRLRPRKFGCRHCGRRSARLCPYGDHDCGQFLFRAYPWKKAWRRLAAGSLTVVLGVCLSSAVFYATGFFYKPIPVKLDVVFDYPISGSIVSEANNDEKGRRDPHAIAEKSERPFQFFPTDVNDTVITWSSLSEKDGLIAEWSSLAKSTEFDVTIEFYADCFRDGINAATSIENHLVRVNHVSNLRVSLDAGQRDFGTFSHSEMSGNLITEFGLSTLFSLDLEGASKSIKLTQFVGENANLTVQNVERDLGFYVTIPLMTSKGEGIVAASRRIKFELDGKTYLVEGEKPQVEKKMGELECRSIEPSAAIKEDRETLRGAASYLGALIRIAKRTGPNAVYGVQDNSLKVFGGNGWISLTVPMNRVGRQDHSGSANLISFKGNISSLDIDGQSITGRSIDGYSAFGEFTGSFEDSARVRFEGRAIALWKNGARVNPTRWERLRWEQSLAILGAIFSTLASIAGYVAMQMRNDVKIDWRS
jgi:hypothetical protein